MKEQILAKGSNIGAGKGIILLASAAFFRVGGCPPEMLGATRLGQPL